MHEAGQTISPPPENCIKLAESITDQQTPTRHHRRTSSRNAKVKETLNARSHYGSNEDDGASIVRVNQYIIKDEIGRGSFGAVHLAVDQYGTEYAVKEFSKSRLRKRAQSNLLRKANQKRPSGYLAADPAFQSRTSSGPGSPAANNSLDLIKEEIAIMKKLDHHNVVALIEVLDDPDEDSLYMVLEMCKKGVVMKVGLDDTADPYDDETCRRWFRDMILGIEYLHAQGIIHRDIKPDNCLVTDDDVLKIVDFGVSEMFEKHSSMSTSKSAGSPAFMPPELCVAKHGPISGRAADIWSMGVTLFCLRYGRIPFNKNSVIELYDAIRTEDISFDDENDSDFRDLMRSLLAKEPEQRIAMKQLRDHPWVTKHGQEPLPSMEENCADIVDPPTEAEKNHAITGNMGHIMAVVGAVKRFKQLLTRRRSESTTESTRFSRLVSPTLSENQDNGHGEAHRRLRGALHRAGEAMHSTKRPATQISQSGESSPRVDTNQQTGARSAPKASSQPSTPSKYTSPDHEGHGQARDPRSTTLILDVGAGLGSDGQSSSDPQSGRIGVSESPSGVGDTCIYEEAYKQEMARIVSEQGPDATVYPNRRMEHDEAIRLHQGLVGHRTSPHRADTDDERK